MPDENKNVEPVAESTEPAVNAEQPKAVDDSSVEEKIPEEGDLDELTTLHERTIATLSYISFLAVIPFYLKKDSKFCRFHGKQGLLMAILFFLAAPLYILDLFFDLALILMTAIFLYMGLAALSGRWKKMPWIYKKACQLEDQLSLKTKEELKEEKSMKPDQVSDEQPAETDEPKEGSAK